MAAPSSSLQRLLPSLLADLAEDAGSALAWGRALSVEHAGARLESPMGVELAPDGQLPRQGAAAWQRGARLLQLAPGAAGDSTVEGLLDTWVLVAALRHRLGSPARQPGELFHLAIGVAGTRDGAAEAAAVVDVLGQLGRSAQLLQPRQAWAADQDGLAELQVLPRIPRSVVLQPGHGASAELLARLGTRILEEAQVPLTLQLDPTALGHHELSTVLSEAGAPGGAELAPELFADTLRYEDTVALLGTLAETATSQGMELGVQLRCPAGGPLGAALREFGAPLEQLPALWLAHLLTERLRARLPTSLRLLSAGGRLERLPLTGLRPLVQSPGQPGPRLGSLAEAVEHAGAVDLDDLSCRRALQIDDGKPFRRRVREHAEVNAGVCLRDRQWEATWSAFTSASDELPVRAALERALVGQDLPAHVADAIARTVQGACHRVVLASDTAALRSGEHRRR